jgi:hypothetical protein
MEVEFTVISKLILEHTPGSKELPQHKGLKWFLELSRPLDPNHYFENDNPNAEGVKVITKVLCNALIANIHYAHQMKLKDSAEHFREAIEEMQSLFVAVADCKSDTF